MAAQMGIRLRCGLLFFYSSQPFSATLVLYNTAFRFSISHTFHLCFSWLGNLDFSYTLCHLCLFNSHVCSLRYSLKRRRLCSHFFSASCTSCTYLIPFHILALYLAQFFCFCLTQSGIRKSLYVPKKYLDTCNMRLKHLSEGKLALPYF